MHALVTPFVQLCLLRLRPQDLPASTLLLGFALGAHVLTSLLVSLVILDVGTAVLAATADTALVCALNAALLVSRGLAARVKQTLTALAGAGAIIGLVALPVMAWLHALRDTEQPVGTPMLLWLLLVAWSVTVSGHILRHALSVSLGAGIVISVAFYWVAVSVLGALFPLT